ncbi:hypothetical protein PT974_10063 [Cladobotryum mycophilum]|uniref:Uncharacterized protein n=1 Tax=Cladobotryum mycophilum TaxID=491253 RepID=A0ABR0S9B5_9HYPO
MRVIAVDLFGLSRRTVSEACRWDSFDPSQESFVPEESFPAAWTRRPDAMPRPF